MSLAKGGFLYLLGDISEEGGVVGAIVTSSPVRSGQFGTLAWYSASADMLVPHLRRLLAEVLHVYGHGDLDREAAIIREHLTDAYVNIRKADIVLRPGLPADYGTRKAAFADAAAAFEVELAAMRKKFDDLVKFARGG